MIELFEGVPGSGKSLHTAACIKDWCRFGHPVICNFPVNTELKYIKKALDNNKLFIIDNYELTPKKLISISQELRMEYPYKEDGIHLVIDECQLLFNSREWNLTNNRMEWCTFFTQHRHYKFHIILVCQFDRMIDRQIRSLIEFSVHHLKLKNYGWRGYCLGLFLGFNSIMCVRKWYSQNLYLSSSIIRFNKRSLFKLYDTEYIFKNPSIESSAAGSAEGVGGSLRGSSSA